MSFDSADSIRIQMNEPLMGEKPKHAHQEHKDNVLLAASWKMLSVLMTCLISIFSKILLSKFEDMRASELITLRSIA